MTGTHEPRGLTPETYNNIMDALEAETAPSLGTRLELADRLTRETGGWKYLERTQRTRSTKEPVIINASPIPSTDPVLAAFDEEFGL